MPDGTLLNNGDFFTIAGHLRMKNGKVITNCKPSMESKWIAKIKKPQPGSDKFLKTKEK